MRNAEVTIAQQGIVHAELDLVIPGGSSGSIPDHSESILSPNSHSADPTETASAKQTILWRPVNRLPVSNPCRRTVPVQPAPSCGITSASPACCSQRNQAPPMLEPMLGTPRMVRWLFAQPSPFRSATNPPVFDLWPTTVPSGPFPIVEVSWRSNLPLLS